MLVDFYKSLFFFFGKKKKSPVCYIYANKVYSEKIKEDNFSSCFSVLVFCSHRNQFFLIIRNKLAKTISNQSVIQGTYIRFGSTIVQIKSGQA